MKKVLQLLTLTTLLATPLSTAPIHDAARAGDLAEVERLINEDPALAFAYAREDFSGNTPLHWAAHRGHTEIVRLLLTRGVKVNAENFLGYTPLHSAVIGGHTAVVELLLVYGADVNTQASITGETSLDIARGHNRAAVIEYLIMVPLLQSLRDQAYQACSGIIPAR